MFTVCHVLLSDCRYVRVVGVYNSMNRSFHLVSFACLYTLKSFKLTNRDIIGGGTLLLTLPLVISVCPPANLHLSLWSLSLSPAPEENVASIAASATVLDGVSRSRNALLNGSTRDYDWDSGYTCHQLGSGCIMVQLAQPYMISSMR